MLGFPKYLSIFPRFLPVAGGWHCHRCQGCGMARVSQEHSTVLGRISEQPGTHRSPEPTFHPHLGKATMCLHGAFFSSPCT